MPRPTNAPSKSNNRVTNGDLSERLTAIERRLEVVERERNWFRETFDRISESTNAIREKVEVMNQRQFERERVLNEIREAIQLGREDA